MLDHFLHMEWLQLLVVVTAGFLIGLEIKAYRVHHDNSKEIGSVRTYAFIALMSYVFAKIDIYFYIVGYLAIIFHLSFWRKKLPKGKITTFSPHLSSSRLHLCTCVYLESPIRSTLPSHPNYCFLLPF